MRDIGGGLRMEYIKPTLFVCMGSLKSIPIHVCHMTSLPIKNVCYELMT